MIKFLSIAFFTIAAGTFTANFILHPTAWHFGATMLSYGAVMKVVVQFYLRED